MNLKIEPKNKTTLYFKLKNSSKTDVIVNKINLDRPDSVTIVKDGLYIQTPNHIPNKKCFEMTVDLIEGSDVAKLGFYYNFANVNSKDSRFWFTNNEIDLRDGKNLSLTFYENEKMYTITLRQEFKEHNEVFSLFKYDKKEKDEEVYKMLMERNFCF